MDSLLGIRSLNSHVAHLGYGSVFIKARSLKYFFVLALFAFSPLPPRSFMRLGFHLSIAGSLCRAVKEAQVLGCQALQIFIQNPRGWKWRPVAPPGDPGFLPGPASGRAWAPWWCISAISPTWPRPIPLFMPCPPRGCPGNWPWPGICKPTTWWCIPATGPRWRPASHRVARALALAVSQVPPPPLILLENTAGQGQELGWRFQHLERIIS